jgi:hypothetical protein
MNAELEAAIVELEALARRKGLPTRHDVRPILLALGGSLPSAGVEDGEACRKRFLALPLEFRTAWEAAVRDELAMACTEHIRSVDPRYLDHPAYDFGYTLEARRALEARLCAARATGVELEEALAAAVGRADALLEARLARTRPVDDRSRRGSTVE